MKAIRVDADAHAHRGAIFSPCRTWRYSLARGPFVGWPGSRALFVMLNPSTADEIEDDPTIRRCIGFARDWLCERLVICNLFAYRSTDPAALRTVPREQAIGPENDEHLRREIEAATLIVCAWGVHGKLGHRGEYVREMIVEAGKKPYALGLTKDGLPRHPLYLRSDVEPILWT